MKLQIRGREMLQQAKGLLKAMTKFSFLATMHFLKDVVPIIEMGKQSFSKGGC